MEITPGRAVYSPDEELKPLRQPKTYPIEAAAGNSSLSIDAAEFVPRFSISTTNLQERLQKHQKQYLQDNYHQQRQQYPQQQQQQQQQQQSYSNGYDNQQQQLQQQQYHQSSQNINAQMGALAFSSVQDRIRRGNNSASRSGEAGSYLQLQQQQQQPQLQRGNGGSQHDYQQNNHYRFNKNHNNHQQHQHQHHHNQHRNRFNNENNSQQQQFQPQNQQLQSSNASALAESANDMENIALEYLQSVIQCLNQNPGQFDSIATRFNYIFEGMENNCYVLSIAMEDIFDESIRNPNFRYMGAKLYNLLHTLNPSKDSLFHTLLKYKLDFQQQQVREFIQKKQEAKVRETALFLAELYMQLRGENSRNNLIAENIVFSLKELLSMEDNKDNLRCICLTLKLAGYDLSTDCPNDMRDIITKLDAINIQNPGKYPLANNVISLQKNNWGRKTNGSVTQAEAHTSQQTQPLRDSDDPVFYGPDGREITAEECEFLTSVAADQEKEEDTDDVDIDLDPEMDEETERDFKLFLKQANNNS